ncbi:MAG: thioredoxin family protein [Phycisphaerae bacterium]
MIHVEIVGEDGPDTRLLAESAKAAVNRLGVRADVCLACDRCHIDQYRTLAGPGMFIDGVLCSTGSLLDSDDVCELIRWRHPELGHQ